MNTPKPPSSSDSRSADSGDLHRSEVTLTAGDLPLHCPMPSQRLWNSHPRVFLPITPGGQVRCPYCGTLYHLPTDVGLKHPH